MKKGIFCIICLGILLTVPACSVRKKSTEKIQDVDFTVLEKEEIPKELEERIEEKQMEEFKITYMDQGSLYIARGYGGKETDGYSVEVKACYETADGICIHTELLGPSKEEKVVHEETNPYVVVKLSDVDKYVIFQ